MTGICRADEPFGMILESKHWCLRHIQRSVVYSHESKFGTFESGWYCRDWYYCISPKIRLDVSLFIDKKDSYDRINTVWFQGPYNEVLAESSPNCNSFSRYCTPPWIPYSKLLSPIKLYSPGLPHLTHCQSIHFPLGFQNVEWNSIFFYGLLLLVYLCTKITRPSSSKWLGVIVEVVIDIVGGTCDYGLRACGS